MPYVTGDVNDGCTRLRLTNTDTNILTIDAVRELNAALTEAEASTNGIMLCGGDKFFCNGPDLVWALSQSPKQMRDMFQALGDLVLRMLEAPLPIVGVIKGHAIGAGKTLIIACDYRYSATGRVLVGVPEILLGVPNPYFADQLLRFVSDDKAASDLIYTGRLISAEDSVAIGLTHQVGAKSQIETLAWDQVRDLAEIPRAAFAECKTLRTERLCARIREQMPHRISRLVEIWRSPEAQGRLRAAAERLAK